MIFGIILSAAGYSVLYWGIHHFPGWDCPTKTGCRYSLLELLGVPKKWGIPNYPSVGLTAGQQQQAGNQGTQPQTPENQTTPGSLGSSSTGWMNSLLSGLGAPTSFNNQNKCNAWNACEGNLQGHSGLGINNPFNITADSYQPATHGDFAVNSDGVQSFSTLTAGIKGTIAKLQEPFAAAIKSNLVTDGTFSDFANAVGSSGWGTSGSCIAGKAS
jgi:hypothetical protein